MPPTTRPTATAFDAGYSACLDALEHLGTHPEVITHAELLRDDARARRGLVEVEERRKAIEIRIAAVRACSACDASGYLESGHLCDHDPASRSRLRRGLDAARSALGDRVRPYAAPQTEEVSPR